MPKITYLEFRPGKWVKLADGKIVGPATAAEVAAWKQERAAPARIWEDVIKVSKTPTVKSEAPARSGAGKESDPSITWDDIVKRSKKPEGPPAPRPRQEDTDWGEQAQLWQDVVKRARKTARELQCEPTAKAGARPEKAKAREVTAAKPAPQPTRAAEPATKAKARPAPQAAPAKVGGSAERKTSSAKSAPDTRQAAGEALPSATPVTVTAPKVAEKDKTAPKATTAKKVAAARPERAKSRSSARLPAKPAIPEDASMPTPRPAKEAVAPRPTRSRATPSRRSATEDGVAGLRRTTKTKTPLPQERPNQSYLWIFAAQSDDLLTALRTGLARYQERFSRPAEVVLCHASDLPALEGARLPIDLREGKSLAPRNFWIGLK